MPFVGTSTPLAASGAPQSGDTWTSDWKLADRYDRIRGTIFADKTGTLKIQQSPDGVNVDYEKSIAVVASTAASITDELYCPYWRVTFVNTGAAQTAMRLQAKTYSEGDS